MDQNCRAMYTHECRLIPHNCWDKSEWTRTVALCIHMNVGYSFVISEIIKSERTRTVALCVHMNVGYSFLISEIIKSEWTRTVALCIHMNVGFFFVRLNARGKKRVCTQQVMMTETAETQVFEFLTTRQNFLLSCQSDVAVRKVTSTPEICSGGPRFECRPGRTAVGDVFCRFPHLLKMNTVTVPYIRPWLRLPQPF
jgi:succinate dehydrogenase hydrophobic anchor subunit